jgi:hypothetical protein
MRPLKTPEAEPTSGDELEGILEMHGGDMRAALQTLLNDCHRLHGELVLASRAVSIGLTRGWTPRIYMDEGEQHRKA